MPFDGGVLEQPWALLVLGAGLRSYAETYAVYRRDGQNAPDDVKLLVETTMAAAMGN